MTINLKHQFVSAKADGTDASKIQPSNWNALHQLTAAAKRLMGRYADTDGDVQEISVGSGLDLSDAGVLSAPDVVTATANPLTGVASYSVGTDVLVLSANDTQPTASFPFLAVRSDANYEAVSVPSPYSPGHILHPSVLYFKDGKCGYKYWMAYTPYPDSNSDFENPCIAVSNDGKYWVVPAGLTNPIFAKPVDAGDYNADTDLYWNGSQFVLVWATIGEGGPANFRLYIATSINGISWGERTQIWDGTINVSVLVSPSIWYNTTTSKWEIYGHNVGTGGAGALAKITSSSLLSGWDVAITAVTAAPPAGRSWWHSQLRRLSDGSVVGIAQDNNGGAGSSGNLYALFSPDGSVFSFAPLDLNGAWYRPSFVIRDDVIRGEYVVEFFGSKLTTSHLFRKMMRFEKGSNQLSPHIRTAMLNAAALALSPILLADTFNRSDDATTLGTSTSGQAWTAIAGPTNVLGISGNKCYNVTTLNCRSTINVGVTDYLARIRIDTKSAEMYLIVRYIDTSNYLRIGVTSSSGQLKFQRITGAAVAVDTSLGVTPVNGDELIIRCAGGQITIWLNERLISTIIETQGLTSTTMGVMLVGTLGGRLDNLLVTSL